MAAPLLRHPHSGDDTILCHFTKGGKQVDGAEVEARVIRTTSFDRGVDVNMAHIRYQ